MLVFGPGQKPLLKTGFLATPLSEAILIDSTTCDFHFIKADSHYILCKSLDEPLHKFAMSFLLHELHCITRRHMTLYDVKIHHGSLESGWTLLTL